MSLELAASIHTVRIFSGPEHQEMDSLYILQSKSNGALRRIWKSSPEQCVDFGIQLFPVFVGGLALGCIGKNMANYYPWGDQIFLRKTLLYNV